jgi:hypothetical protein
VAHDTTALTVTSAVIAGTDAAALLDFGFDATSKENIETCDVVPGCANRTAGGGWISAVVLSFTKPIELPLKRNTIAKSGYTLSKDVGEAGTLITVSNKLAKQKSPPADVNVTVDGKSRRWTTAVNAWVKKEGEVTPADQFVRGDVGVSKTGESHPADEILNVTDPVRIIRKLFQGSDLEFDCQKAADADDNGAVEITDAVYLCNYLFVGGASGPAPPAPFPSAGDDPTSDGLTCVQYP